MDARLQKQSSNIKRFTDSHDGSIDFRKSISQEGSCIDARQVLKDLQGLDFLKTSKELNELLTAPVRARRFSELSEMQAFEQREDPAETELVRRYVQTVVGQQEVESTMLAAQQLEKLEHLMDERLSSQVSLSHEQLLTTLVSTDSLYGELETLTTEIASLQQAIKRMKLRIAVPLAQLNSNMSSMQRCEDTLNLLSLMKRLSQQSRLFSAEFKTLANISILELPKAALALREIQDIMKQLTAFMGTKDVGKLASRLPAINDDLVNIQESVNILTRLAASQLEESLSSLNHVGVSASCETLLQLGGPELVIVNVLSVFSAVTTNVSAASDFQKVLGLLSPSSSYGMHSQAIIASSGFADSIWQSIADLLQKLQEGLRKICCLELELHVLERMNRWMTTTHGIVIEENFDNFHESIRSAVALKFRCDGHDVSFLYWNFCIGMIKLSITKLLISSTSVSNYLRENCPRFYAQLSNARDEMTVTWRLQRRVQAERFALHSLNQSLDFGESSRDSDDLLGITKMLVDILDNLVNEYLRTTKATILNPVKLMFPNQITGKSLTTIPTSSDIKTFINIITSELNRVAIAPTLAIDVVSVVKEGLMIFNSNCNEAADSNAKHILLKTANQDGEIPMATPGHKRNARLFSICQLLYCNLTEALASDDQKSLASVEDLCNEHSNKTKNVEMRAEYNQLKPVMQLLMTTKECLIAGWFSSIKDYIKLELQSLMRNLCKIDESISEQAPDDNEIIGRLNQTLTVVNKEYLTLVQPESVTYYGRKECRSIIHWFIAAQCFVKPLNNERQRVALAAHATSLEVLLSNHLCSNLQEDLALTCLLLKAFRRLLFVDVENFLNGMDGESELSATLQIIPLHILILHFFSRLPEIFVNLETYLGIAINKTHLSGIDLNHLCEQISLSLMTPIEVDISPSVIQQKILSIIKNTDKNVLSKCDSDIILLIEQLTIETN